MAKTTRIFDIEKVVHGNKVKTDFIAAPFTQIKGEDGQSRKIPDLENNLKASFGVERIHVKSINELNNEFGPNGEAVYEAQNKDARIRFVGDWKNTSSTNGAYVGISTAADTFSFVEITFYGTGLNLLFHYDVNDGDFRASVDGGVESGNLYDPNLAGVINVRNYEMNAVLPIASGLSLGIHTVKIRNNNAPTNPLLMFGCEILNESSQLTVNSGKPFTGNLASKLDSQTLLDLKPSGISGAKGGRVITYINENGELGQAVTEVDSTALYLGSTDHSNEEIIRKINIREFSRNRADDFSSLDGVDRDLIFTLDDGTTTLVANNVRASSEDDIQLRNTGSFITITFVGTGFSLGSKEPAGALPTVEVYVDDVLQGTYSRANKFEICSGLPYGTHTVTLLQTGASNSSVFQDIYIYGPKKPTLPENSVEIADHNVVADYVAQAGAQVANEIATGVIQKSNAREITYKGTGFGVSLDVSYPSGLAISTTTSGDSVSYTFFGTGIVVRESNSASNNCTFEIDGSTDFTSYTVDLIGGGSGSFTSATGVYNGQSGSNNAVAIRGLSLGLHTLTITSNSANAFQIDAFDIITPIHSNSKDFKTGSLSLLDLRQDNVIENEARNIDLSKAKAWLIFDSSGDSIVSSYNISAVIDVNGQAHRAYFKHIFKNTPVILMTSSGVGGTVKDYIRDLSGGDALPERNGFTFGADNYGNPAYMAIVCFGELENEEDIDLEDL